MYRLFCKIKWRFVLAVLLLFAVICGAEALFANRMRFALDGKTQISMDLSTAELRGGAVLTEGGIFVKEGASVTFEQVDVEIANVMLSAYSDELFVTEYTVSTMDEASKHAYRTYVDGRVYTDREPAFFEIRSAGKVRTLRIQCNSGEKMLLQSVTLNAVPVFRFSWLRVIAVSFLIAFLYAVWKFRLWKSVYDRHDVSHRAAMLCSLLLCLAFMAIGVAGCGLSEIPYENTEHLNAYEQLFVSMLDGRLNLDVDCDPQLFELLENPYDFSERNLLMEKFGPFWDRAYYEGNFYCYFGIAPLILFFFPIYFLTGMAPNLNLVTLLICVIGVLSLYGALLKMIRYFRMRVSLVALCVGLPVLVLGSMLPMIALCADMYYVACASGLAFVALTLFLGFAALCCEHPIGRRLLFAASGIALATTLASRPTVVLYAAVLVPPFLAVLFTRGRKVIAKLIDALSFVVPLVIFVIPVLLYNLVRFDSLFEFGATYQMTFHDISYNKISFSLLGETLMHYFLQSPQLVGLFPYIRPSHLALDTYGVYFYSAINLGALSFPLSWGGFASGFVTKKQPVKKAVYLLLLALPFVVAFADLCLGGVNIRYMTDILLPLMLLGLLVVAELLTKIGSRVSDGVGYRMFLIVFAILAVTAYVCFALLFANERDNIYHGAPDVFRFFENLFS